MALLSEPEIIPTLILLFCCIFQKIALELFLPRFLWWLSIPSEGRGGRESGRACQPCCRGCSSGRTPFPSLNLNSMTFRVHGFISVQISVLLVIWGISGIQKLGLDKGGRADHRVRREAFAVKFWEREREPTGAVPQPENYTSSFIRRARGGVVVGTRVSRADSPSPGVWCCISGRSTAPSANIRKAVRTEREGKQTQRMDCHHTQTQK